LGAVYINKTEFKNLGPFKLPGFGINAVFQVATTRSDSGVILIKEPPDQAQEAPFPCSWWRRGRVELYHEHGLGVLVVIAAGVNSLPSGAK